MDLTALRQFQAAAQEGNISRAADRLYISRQALSKAIKRLEEQMGVPLIVPTSSGILLTPQGEQVSAVASQILTLWDGLLRDLGRAQLPTSILRVGFGQNSYNLWKVDHIRQYMEKCPTVQIEYKSLLPDQLLEELRAGRLDLVISNVRPLGDDLDYRPILARPCYALLSRGDPLAARQVVTPADLAGRSVLFIPEDRTGMTHFSHLMEVYGLTCAPFVSSDASITTIWNELTFHQGVFITSAIFRDTEGREDFLLCPFDTGLPHGFYNLDNNAITRRPDRDRQDIASYVAYLEGSVKPEFRAGEQVEGSI